MCEEVMEGWDLDQNCRKDFIRVGGGKSFKYGTFYIQKAIFYSERPTKVLILSLREQSSLKPAVLQDLLYVRFTQSIVNIVKIGLNKKNTHLYMTPKKNEWIN